MSARLRLLATTDAVGGIWTYSLDLARGLANEGIETILAVVGPSPSPSQKSAARRAGAQLLETGLPLDWTAAERGMLSRGGRAIATLASETGAEIVQLHSAAFAAEAGFDVPLVAVQHSCVGTWWDAVRGTGLPRDLAWRCEMVGEGLAASDAVVTPTAAFGQAVRGRYALAAAPNAVHNGRAPLALPKAAPHDFAFTAGRLWDEGKNVATLDAAAAMIPLPIHAAGPVRGPDGSSAGFANIHCLGTLDEQEIGRWLAARPVFVSAALYEPFGLAILEAAMAGCPLVLSDIPTFRELWDGAAWFVDPRDAAGFAHAIAELAGDDFERTHRGRAARERAARYTPAAMAGKMACLYRSLIPAEPIPDPKREARVAA